MGSRFGLSAIAGHWPGESNEQKTEQEAQWQKKRFNGRNRT
jgi:hypothetical protein